MSAHFVLSKQPADSLQEDIETFQRNAAYAEDHFQEFLDRCPGDWILVYADQQVLVGANPEELLAHVLDEQRRSAVLMHLEQPVDALFL